MQDMIDLTQARIINSPPVASWPVTAGITHISEDPRGGFALTFDRVLPDSWKWPSNPDVPSDNFQFTVWAGVLIGGVWNLAGFVQMWQGRPMGNGALPSIFTVNDGVPGYVNWWGDVRHMWAEMSGYVPQPGDKLAMLVSAGNGRLRGDVTSVAERSQVVVFTLPGNDTLGINFDNMPQPQNPDQPAPPVVPPKPQPMDPRVVNLADAIATQLVYISNSQVHIEAKIDALTAKADALNKSLAAAIKLLAPAKKK